MNWAIVADILLVSNWAEAEGSRDGIRRWHLFRILAFPLKSQLHVYCRVQTQRGLWACLVPCLSVLNLSDKFALGLQWALSLVFPGPPTEFPSPQYVVIPTRRSTAEAFQIVLSHLLGDAGSPYLIGLVSTVLDRDGMLLGSGTPYPCRWLVTGA